MSLSLENYDKSQLIATINKNNKIKAGVYYIDEDNFDEELEPIKKIRINKPDEVLFPAVSDFKSTNQTDRIYISGPSGCGKTTWISQYIQAFHTKYPKSKVLLFSSKTNDAVLDKLAYIERVDITEDILADPYTLQEISGLSKPLLTIFDDVEDFPNKKITQAVGRLRDEIMRNGRSYGIYIVYVNHDPCNYKETKQQIFEASKVVIFPKKCGQGTYNYLLDKKLHLPKKIIEVIVNVKSQYVCINKALPQFILSDKYILLQ